MAPAVAFAQHTLARHAFCLQEGPSAHDSPTRGSCYFSGTFSILRRDPYRRSLRSRGLIASGSVRDSGESRNPRSPRLPPSGQARFFRFCVPMNSVSEKRSGAEGDSPSAFCLSFGSVGGWSARQAQAHARNRNLVVSWRVRAPPSAEATVAATQHLSRIWGGRHRRQSHEVRGREEGGG